MPVLFFQKVWAWTKKYWQLILLVVGTIVSMFLMQYERASFSDKLKQIQDAHDEEMKKIDAARLEEERQHKANVKQLQAALDAVNAQYVFAQKTLDEKKKSEIADIVKKYGDNPDELAKQLSEATGFDIVLPTS